VGKNGKENDESGRKWKMKALSRKFGVGIIKVNTEEKTKYERKSSKNKTFKHIFQS
jgi:hypothetical protein